MKYVHSMDRDRRNETSRHQLPGEPITVNVRCIENEMKGLVKRTQQYPSRCRRICKCERLVSLWVCASCIGRGCVRRPVYTEIKYVYDENERGKVLPLFDGAKHWRWILCGCFCVNIKNKCVYAHAVWQLHCDARTHTQRQRYRDGGGGESGRGPNMRRYVLWTQPPLHANAENPTQQQSKVIR